MSVFWGELGLAPQGTLAVFGDILSVIALGSAAGIQCVEARGTVQYATTHRIATRRRTIWPRMSAETLASVECGSVYARNENLRMWWFIQAIKEKWIRITVAHASKVGFMDFLNNLPLVPKVFGYLRNFVKWWHSATKTFVWFKSTMTIFINP